MKTAVRNQAGAFDLPSIMIAVITVAVLTAGILAAIFGIIPFAQDNGTRQDIAAVRTAEGVALAKNGKFTDIPGLVSAGYLSEKAASAQESPSPESGPFVRADSTGKIKTAAGINAKGDCYVALGKSDTGKIFWGSDKASDPLELKPADDTGCITADQLKALVASLGGFEGKYSPSAPTVTGAAQDSLHAAFTWNSVDTATGYRVESRIDGRAWTVINDNQTETTTTVAANPSDVIDVRVTSRNAGGDSGYGTATVKLADPIIANGGFENGLTSWTPSATGATAVSDTVHGGSGAAKLTATGNTSTLSQSVNVPDESFSTLTFWTRATNTSTTGARLEVLSPAGAVLATPYTSTTTDAGWIQQSVDLTDYRGQTVTLRFVASSSYNGYTGTLLLDDVILASTPPVITAAPTRVAAAADDASASLTWAAPSSRATNITSYTVTPYKDGAAQPPVTVTGNPAQAATTLTGLTNGASYIFTVKATNSAGTSPESAASAAVVPGPVKIANAGFEAGLRSWTTSGAVSPSTTTHTGFGSANLTANGSTSTLSQSVNVPAESFSTLTFWTRGTNAYATGNRLEVLSPAGAVLATPYTSTSTDADWVKQSVDLTDFKGQAVTLRFAQSSSYNGYTGTLLLDDLALASTPPVITAAPTGVAAAATDTTASVTWVAPSSRATNITAYTVTPYKAGAAQTPVTVTGNPAQASTTITGLDSNASYTFTVKATNSAGTSAESAPSAAVTTVPVLIQNAGFEAGLNSWATTGTVQTSTTVHSGLGSANVTANSSTSTVSQSVNVPDESFSTLTFWAKATNAMGTNTRLEIVSAAGTVLATPYTSTANDAAWVKQSVDLTDYRGQAVTLRFVAYSYYANYVGTLLLDDLALTSTPPVITAAPTRVGVTADDTTASLTWVAPSSRATNITSYTVTPYKGGAAQAPVTVTGNPATTAATLTGLTNGASYTFTVKATNSAGTSVESAPSAAVVPGPVVIANAGFEAGLKSWTTSGAATASATAHTGFGSAQLSTPGANAVTSISQSINVPAEMFSNLDLWIQTSNNVGQNTTSVQVLSASGTLLATPYSTASDLAAWTKVSVDLTNFKGTTVILRLNQQHSVLSGYAGVAYIDDLVFTSTPPVITAAPTRVGATADDTTASLAWVAPSSRATNITAYTVTPYKDGVAQAPVAITGNPAATSATLTGLTNGATYTFTVKATNSAGTSVESAPSAAVVPGPVAIANAGFEAGLRSWTTTGTAAPSANTHTGFGSAALPTPGYNGESTIAQSVNVPAEMFSTLDFWYITDNASNANYTKLQVLTPAGAVLATPLNTVSTVSSWTKVSVDLTDYKGQTVVLKFTEHNNSNSSNLGTATIDDLVLTSTPPVITDAPTRVGATADDTTASLTWAAPSSRATNITSYTITPYIGPAAQAPVTVTGNPAPAAATLTGLTNGTSYTFTVKATNSAGTSAESVASTAVTPGPVVIANAGFEAGLRSWTTAGSVQTSTATHAGFGSAQLNSVSSGAVNSIAQSINVPANVVSNLDLWITTNNYNAQNVTQVQILNTAGTVLATPLSTTTTYNTWLKISVDLSPYQGTTVVLKLSQKNNNSSYPGAAYFDDLAVTTTAPAVPATPSGVTALGGDSVANVSWTAPASPGSTITAYTVTPYLGGAAQAPVTVTGSPAPTTASVTGLTNGTSYTFTVKATNSAGTSAESAASAAATPSTQVIANGGFESGLTSWTTGGWAPSASSTAHTGVKSALLGNVTNAESNLAQTVVVPNTAAPTLTYWYKSTSTESGCNYDSLAVQARTAPATAGPVLQTTALCTATGSAWNKVTVSLTAYKGQTITFWFNVHNDGSNISSALVDDVSIAG